MERRMLINAINSEEIRIAIVEDDNLIELEIEPNEGKKLKGNIYKAKIARLEPSLQAAFVDIGAERNGFLQINDIHQSYFKVPSNRQRVPFGKMRIQDFLEPGQEIVVQVVKEEREAKGATLTTYLSLPGRSIVLMPGTDRGGVSRRITDSEHRNRLKALSRELEIPSGIGMIIRTAGLDRSMSELTRDLQLQLKVWERVVAQAQTAVCPAVLYAESDVATRVIRDYFTPEIREILIDEPQTFQRIKEFVGQVMPRYRSRVKLYTHEAPIFSYFNVDDEVSDALKGEVKLPSGGSIVIDPLEALVAVDVNSGKATEGESIEETAYKTNLEAASEIARQLRLRDLGGLIIVDFIDMTDRRNVAAVEKAFREALEEDKARCEIGKISRFGLLEMSRQRLRASLSSLSQHKCPHCHGSGTTKNPETVALEVLRKIQAAVILGQVSIIKARLAPTPALFLLNNKKKELVQLESKHNAKIYVLADARLTSGEYEFEVESARSSVSQEKIRRSVEDAVAPASDDDEMDA